jgi:hypothetical protein
MDNIAFTLNIDKQAPDQRRFWGRGYIHTRADGEQVVDASGDVIDTPEAQAALEDAFYEYVKQYRSGDANHELFNAATMIEGFIVTKEKKAHGLFPTDMAEGIYVAFEANQTAEGDVLWDGVKEGRYTALSIVGRGRSEQI